MEAGESEVQDHSWLYNEFKASLDYMKLYSSPVPPPTKQFQGDDGSVDQDTFSQT